MNRISLSATTLVVVLLTSSLGVAQPAPDAPDAPTPPEDPAALDEPEAAPEPDAAPTAEPGPTAPAGDTGVSPTEASTQAPEPVSPAPAEPEPEKLAESQAPDAAPAEEPVAEPPKSWFYREPLALNVGKRLTLTFYGVAQADFIYDTTRSYGDTIGSSLVARGDTYEGTVGRFQASARSTRFGLALDATPISGVTPSAVIEADFAGDQPTSDVGSSERSYYDSPGFRMRYAYLNLGTSVVDMLIGQTDDVFGWQNTTQSVSRHTQFRLSHTFGATSAVGLDIAAAAVRPAQRDSQVPDGQAGVRFNVNAWKGIHTRNGIPTARPLSLGVSGVARQFDVDAFTPPPTQTSNKVVGYGLSIDAMLPVIAAENEYDRSNKLTLSASFITGTGIGDLMRLDGGAVFPPLPNPARASPAPHYDANVDEGLVTFDRLGVLHTIDWQAFRVDAQYYLPPSGRVRIAAVFAEAFSKNMHDLYPQGGAEIELLTHVADRVRYIEGNLFWDVTPEARLGLSGIYTMTEYLDDEAPHNYRGKFTAMYFF